MLDAGVEITTGAGGDIEPTATVRLRILSHMMVCHTNYNE